MELIEIRSNKIVVFMGLFCVHFYEVLQGIQNEYKSILSDKQTSIFILNWYTQN